MRTSSVAKLSVSNCKLGPKAMLTLAPAISDMPALSQVNLSFNKCFGEATYPYGKGYRSDLEGTPNGEHDIDKDQSGWTAFCEALPSTKIEKTWVS